MKKVLTVLLIITAVSAATWWGLNQFFVIGGFDVHPSTNEEGNLYIPKDLDTAIVELDAMLPIDVKRTVKRDQRYLRKLHRSLGMFVRNNWGLWGESDLSKWFNDRKIKNPDYMSCVIFEAYREHLLGFKGYEEILKDYQFRDMDHWLRSQASTKADQYYRDNLAGLDFAPGTDVSSDSDDSTDPSKRIMNFKKDLRSGGSVTVSVTYNCDYENPNFKITKTSNKAGVWNAEIAPLTQHPTL